MIPLPLREAIRDLYYRAVMYPGKEIRIPYKDRLTFGMLATGNTIRDYLWIERKGFPYPSARDLISLIQALPFKYYYDPTCFRRSKQGQVCTLKATIFTEV